MIFLSFSTPITRLIYWDNYYTINNEEAQIIGWASKNIPIGSRILITRWEFYGNDLYLFETYFLRDVMNTTDYDIEDLIGNLTSEKIFYFIYEEQYESDYIELLNSYYTIELYAYGSFMIFKSIEV